MLVQLSPWKTTETSIKVSKTSRRRSRNELDDNKLHSKASFVTTSSRRTQSKWKQHSSELAERQPLLALTTNHKICVIGKTKDADYEEISTLQYSSRPGAAGSFFPDSANDGDLPHVPATLDAKNNRVYALQNGNTRLCCWDSLGSSGPNEKHSAKVELKSPAISLSLLPFQKGVIYGSCLDGTLYIARMYSEKSGENVLTVEYTPSKVEAAAIGTFAEISSSQVKSAGRKRKMSDTEGFTTASIYQIFQQKNHLAIVRSDIQFGKFGASDAIMNDSSLVQRDVRLPVPVGPKETLISTTALVSSSTSSPSVALLFSVKSAKVAKAEELCYCARLSLARGDFSHAPVQLPTAVSHYDLLTTSILACATDSSIFFYDLESGACMLEGVLPTYLEKCESWQLQADTKFGAVAIVCELEGKLNVAFAFAQLDESNDSLLSSTFKLSSKLASCRVNDSGASGHTPSAKSVNDLLRINSKHDYEINTVDDTLNSELERLNSVGETIMTSRSKGKGPVLIEEYEKSVAKVLTTLQKSQQVALVGKEKLVNGSKSPVKNGSKGINGYHGTNDAVVTPSILPLPFLDGTVHLMVSILTNKNFAKLSTARSKRARADALVILGSVFKTGKLSARYHFDANETIQESRGGNKLLSLLCSMNQMETDNSGAFGPVAMIFLVLQKCTDVSERQMVAMLRFMLRNSKPEDVASATNQSRFDKSSMAVVKKFTSGADSLSQRLILVGTKTVLQKIVGYSLCNQSMLRAALLDLIDSSEASIIARLLSEILANPSKQATSKFAKELNVTSSCCQWVSALADCFRDDLVILNKGERHSQMNQLLTSTKIASKQSHLIKSLSEDIRRVEMEIEATAEAKKNHASGRAVLAPEELPGYSIDRLIF